MNPLLFLLAFLGAAVPIVAVTTGLAYPKDPEALRHFPRRLLGFVGSCGLLALVLWGLQFLFVDRPN